MMSLTSFFFVFFLFLGVTFLQHRCCFLQHPIPYKPLILLTFFTLLFSLLYIRLKVPQGTGRIFEKNTQKSPPSISKKSVRSSSPKGYRLFFLICPCKTFFGSCAFLAKPTDKKQSNGSRLGQASIRAEPLRSFVPR